MSGPFVVTKMMKKGTTKRVLVQRRGVLPNKSTKNPRAWIGLCVAVRRGHDKPSASPKTYCNLLHISSNFILHGSMLTVCPTI